MSGFVSNLFKSDTEPMLSSTYKYKTRFSMIGTVGSGKSAVVAGIVLTSMTKSADNKGFRCRVLENETNIIEDVSNLRQGRFPQKTPAHQAYVPEAGLLAYYPGMFGLSDKKVQIPICDLAGEDIQYSIRSHRRRNPLDPASFQINMRLIEHLKKSDGYILVVPASRALLFQNNMQIEEGSPELSKDPDVNLHRILSEMITYKERVRGKRIKGIAVIITKWDLIMPFAEDIGMDVYTPEGLEFFMKRCFPGTSMELKAYGLNKVRFFPSYFQAMRRKDLSVIKWPDNSDRIDMHDLRMPKYSEDSYMQLFEWLKGFAT